MWFERIESKGLAHYSYLVGDQGEAMAIDPRRDCDVYVDLAARHGYRLAHILETHRNEDYAIGSVELAARTGAEVWHADAQWPYRYGQPVADGQTWRIGRLEVQALHSPGHTPGSMSYVLHEPGSAPWMVFSGDALFAGDVGRVDLLGADRLDEMAGQLYDTLFQKLLPLGDGVIVCPAHGSGSVCGSSISDRPWTTLGLERRINPMLQVAFPGDFVAKAARRLEVPPYFTRMEKWNLEGAPLLGTLPIPAALPAHEVAAQLPDAVLLDTRDVLAFAEAHIPGALSIWLDGLPSFAGWFLPYDTPLLLVTDDGGDRSADAAVRALIRLGYDQMAGILSGGMLAWHEAGLESQSHRTVTVQALCRRIDAREPMTLLDVRSADELANDGDIPGTLHIHVTQLPGRIAEIPRDRSLYVFCGSGLRSTIAAGLLQRQGWDDVTVVLGGFSAWAAAGCPGALPGA
jgi:hydroxyacylglutathione hydrolase